MSEKLVRGYALIEHYRKIYEQNLFEDYYFVLHPNEEPIKTTKEELDYAVEITEIMQGKYAECSEMPSANYMAKLLEAAEKQGRKVGYISFPYDIIKDRCDGTGYIGVI